MKRYLTEDVINLAAFTARGIATRLVRIQKIRSAHTSLVIDMRREAIKTTVEALWRRYMQYSKRDGFEYETFADWLAAERCMEDTFWHLNNTGLSLGVRRRMAIRYHSFLKRRELQLHDGEDERYGVWVLEALEAAINAKQRNVGSEILVTDEYRKALPSQGLKTGGTTFVFNRVPVEGEPFDWSKRLEGALTGISPARD